MHFMFLLICEWDDWSAKCYIQLGSIFYSVHLFGASIIFYFLLYDLTSSFLSKFIIIQKPHSPFAYYQRSLHSVAFIMLNGVLYE